MASTKKKRHRRKVSADRRIREHQSSGGFDRTHLVVPKGVKFFVPEKQGKYLLDIIPYEVGKGNPYADEGQLHYERTFYVHRKIGAEESTYVCPSKTAGKKCPICKYMVRLRNEDAKENKDLIKALKPKERQLFHLINLDEKEEGVQVWEVAPFNFGELLDSRVREADEDEPFTMFADLEDGMTLKVSLHEETFMGNDFLKASSIDFKPRKRQYDEDILEQTFNFDEMVMKAVLPFDKLKAIFEQSEEEDGDEEEEEERRRSKKKSKKRHRDEDEEEQDEDDDGDEDEDEEEEAPRKKSKKKHRHEDEDDDE